MINIVSKESTIVSPKWIQSIFKKSINYRTLIIRHNKYHRMIYCVVLNDHDPMQILDNLSKRAEMLPLLPPASDSMVH